MDARHDKKNTDVEVDRLSDLPDDLIHKILSFIGLKDAIKASSLSSRWRFIWTSMPFLDFSILHYGIFTMDSDYVTQVLCRRNNLAQVFSIKLCFSGNFNEECFQQIIKYAFSHNIQQLDVTWLLENNMELPLSLFNSHSLKHLSLIKEYDCVLTTTSTWELPALTTLHLDGLTLCCDDGNAGKCFPLFSKCPNLKNLSLRLCRITGLNSLTLSICNPQLINLRIENHFGGFEDFNVVTPKLKNLTIRYLSWDRCIISAPELISLRYDCVCCLRLLSTDGFKSLETVQLCVLSQCYKDALAIVRLFHDIKSVKFLKLNLEMAELLSSHVEIVSEQPSPFTNLKMLEIYPVLRWNMGVGVSTEVKNYLLDSSPGATFTMVTREEFIVMMRNTELAQELMTDLRMLIDEENYFIEYQVRGEGRMSEDLIEIGKEKTRQVFSELEDVKEIITKLLADRRAEMQACFSSLCADADTLANYYQLSM